MLDSSDMPHNVGYRCEKERKRDERQEGVGHAREQDHEEDDQDRQRPGGGHP